MQIRCDDSRSPGDERSIRRASDSFGTYPRMTSGTILHIRSYKSAMNCRGEIYHAQISYLRMNISGAPAVRTRLKLYGLSANLAVCRLTWRFQSLPDLESGEEPCYLLYQWP